MWLETMIDEVKGVPTSTTASLAQLRQRDRQSKDLMTALVVDEAALFYQLGAAQAAAAADPAGVPLDVALFMERAKELIWRRAALTALLEEQSRMAQTAYNDIDARVAAFDRHAAPLEHLLLLDPSETLNKRKKKKKKKKKKSAALGGDALDGADGADSGVDPNEPVYCTCRMVSFGNMIGCESEDCRIEWFHLGCVGLTEKDQPEKWYCYECCTRLGITNE